MEDVTRRSKPMALFALAALAPLALLLLGARLGGGWAVAGFLYMAGLALVLDQIKGLFMGDAHEGAEFPAADALLAALGLGTLVLMPLTVWAVAGDSGLAWPARLALFAGAGLWLGQVSHPAGHELIHRGNRGLYGLGVAVYGVLLFGHHASAHRLVHHRHVASALDPNSARPGEGFYRFFLRAWAGSFRAGLAAERALSARGARRRLNPYVVYVGFALASLAAGWAIAGLPGLLVWGALGLHAQLQILLSDYVQHYGLHRATGPDGRAEPVAAHHSWNAPHWFSSAFMLNAPRHSDHHAHPARPYPALRLPGPEEAPTLPWPLPVACTLALFPKAWKRRIAPHLARWRE
jgi:alkane 1-monooxygenase